MKNLNKKIIITGGNSGIGKDLLVNFLSKSFKVLCISRRKPDFDHKNLKYIKINLSKKEELVRKEKEIKNFKCKYLICNAADLGEINYIENINLKKWEKSFFLNLFSHVYLTKYCINSVKRNRGAFFFIAGGGAANSFKKFSSYSLSKTAIVRFAENLAVESKDQFFSYSITPGPVNTKLMRKTLKHGHQIKLDRIVKSERCVNLINFLIKSKKKFINGKYIHVNDNYKKFTKENTKNLFLLRRAEDRDI
jgi:NAD(P)-dependent dehydrogenase (short-subunit alcohol dehydrogenase family)